MICQEMSSKAAVAKKPTVNKHDPKGFPKNYHHDKEEAKEHSSSSYNQQTVEREDAISTDQVAISMKKESKFGIGKRQKGG